MTNDMDYEKKYNEALERAKAYYNELHNCRAKDELESIFPELRESEDEQALRIIKKRMCYDPVPISDEDRRIVENWLEKQKDINCLACDQHLKGYLAGRKVTEEEMQKENTEGDFARGYDCGYECCLNSHGAEWLEKQKEQKPVDYESELKKCKDNPLYFYDKYVSIKQKPVEWKPQAESLEALMYAVEGKWEMIKPTSYLSRRLEDLYEGLVNTFHIDETYLDKLSKAASAGDIEGLRALKQKIDASMEQYAEEKQDYSGLTEFERAIHRGFLCAGVENVPVTIIKETAQDCLAQIKPAEWSDYKDKVNVPYCSSEPEWSEEDEKKIHFLSRLIELQVKDDEYCFGDGTMITKQGAVEMLKSLRPQPQGTYKLIVHNIYEMLKDKDFFDIPPSHRVSLLNDIRVRCKNADEQAEILDIPSWKPSENEERLINTSISFLKDFADKGYENAVECIDWLKSKLNGNTCK